MGDVHHPVHAAGAHGGLLLTPCLHFSGVGGSWVLAVVLGTLLNFFPQCFALASVGGLRCPSTSQGAWLYSVLPLWGDFWDESVSHPDCTQADGAVANSAKSCNSSCVLVCRDGRWLVDISSALRKISLLFSKQDETEWGWIVLSSMQAWARGSLVTCFCSNRYKEWDF